MPVQSRSRWDQYRRGRSGGRPRGRL